MDDVNILGIYSEAYNVSIDSEDGRIPVNLQFSVTELVETGTTPWLRSCMRGPVMAENMVPSLI